MILKTSDNFFDIETQRIIGDYCHRQYYNLFELDHPDMEPVGGTADVKGEMLDLFSNRIYSDFKDIVVGVTTALSNALTGLAEIFATIVVLTVFTHWTLVQVYARYCAPSGWTGPFQTFLTLGSPMCHFTNMIQVELAKHYITIWIAAAAATATRIASNVITYGTPNQIDT